MPIVDGIEGTRTIIEQWGRQQDQAPSPIVALTAYNTEDTKNECLQSGMIDLQTKPLEIKLLDEVLKTLKIIPK